MAKISELKKVQLLEEAVLACDIELVHALFDEYQKFEFTARALGLACRYCGIEMVQLLTDRGATFCYDTSPSFSRKYDCLVKYSNKTNIHMDYALLLLKAYKKIPYVWESKCRKQINNKEREKIIAVIAEKESKSLGAVLYYSILLEDDVLYTILRKEGIDQLDKYYDYIVTGKYGMCYDYDWTFNREWLMTKLYESDVTTHQKILNRLFEVASTDNWKMFPSDCDGYKDLRQIRIRRLCSTELFDFYYSHTNFAEKITRDELINALIDNDNVDGMAKIFEHWSPKLSQYNDMLKRAQSQGKVQVVACLINYLNGNESLAKKSHSESKKVLNYDPNSVAELKKIWGYKPLKDGKIVITSYKGQSKYVIVPETIGKNKVTAIDKDAFELDFAPRTTEEQKKNRQAIESLTIPGTIENIPDRFFSARSRKNYALRKLVIEKGTRKIGTAAFSSCPNLEELVLPNTIKSMGEDAFSECKEAVFDEINSIPIPGLYYGLYYRKKNGAIEIYKIKHIRSDGEVEIPKEIEGVPVRKICDLEGKKGYFSGEILGYGEKTKKISRLIIPDSIEEIENCPGVTDSIIVDEKNPHYCTDGISLLSKDKQIIYKIAVLSTKEYNLPEGIQKINPGVFEYVASGLERVLLPQSLNSIAEKTFYHCRKLKEITIPSGVENIGELAFGNDVSWGGKYHNRRYDDPAELEAIHVSPDNRYFTEIAGVLFTKDKHKLITYPPSKKDSLYEIPDGTEVVGREAFYRTKYLEGIRIPASVKKFEFSEHDASKGTFEASKNLKSAVIDAAGLPPQMFSYCRELSQIQLLEHLKSIGYYCFEYTSLNSSITLPKHLEKIDFHAFPDNVEELIVYDTITAVGIGESVRYTKCNRIIVKDAKTDKIKYIVPRMVSDESNRIITMLEKAWLPNAEFDFTKMDSMFMEYKNLWNRAVTARARLEYGYKLSDDSRKMYTDFLARNGLKILTMLIEENKLEDLRCYAELGALTKNNIDKVLAAVAEKKNTELIAWLLEFKKKNLKGSK